MAPLLLIDCMIFIGLTFCIASASFTDRELLLDKLKWILKQKLSFEEFISSDFLSAFTILKDRIFNYESYYELPYPTIRILEDLEKKELELLDQLNMKYSGMFSVTNSEYTKECDYIRKLAKQIPEKFSKTETTRSFTRRIYPKKKEMKTKESDKSSLSKERTRLNSPSNVATTELNSSERTFSNSGTTTIISSTHSPRSTDRTRRHSYGSSTRNYGPGVVATTSPRAGISSNHNPISFWNNPVNPDRSVSRGEYSPKSPYSPSTPSTSYSPSIPSSPVLSNRPTFKRHQSLPLGYGTSSSRVPKDLVISPRSEEGSSPLTISMEKMKLNALSTKEYLLAKNSRIQNGIASSSKPQITPQIQLTDLLNEDHFNCK